MSEVPGAGSHHPGPRRRASRIAWLWLGVLVLCVLRPAPVAADQSRFSARLNYDVDPSLPNCGDEADFRKRIIRRVGYDPFRNDAEVSVAVRVDGAAWAIGGSVYWVDARGTTMGERRFVAKDGNCAKLLAEMGFAVALQIQMLGVAGTEPPAGVADAGGAGEGGSGAPGEAPSAAASPPAPSPAQAQATHDVAEPPSPPLPERRLSMWLGTGPQAAYGITPAIAGQGRLFFGIRRGDQSMEIGGEANYPTTFRRWAGSGFREFLLAGSLALCQHHGTLAGCVMGKAGQLRTSGANLDQPRSPAAFVAHAGVRLAATIDLSSSWFAAVHLDGLVLLTPRTIDIAGSEIWKMPALAAFGGVDIARRFW